MSFVKVCGITNVEGAEAALEAGADALGFVYEPSSPRRLLSLDLPSHVRGRAATVAVYGTYDGQTTPCSLVQSASGAPAQGEFIRAVRLGPDSSVDGVASLVAGEPRRPWAVLLDAFDPLRAGGTGMTVDWGLAARIVAALDVPVILAGGLDPENVAGAIRTVRPFGVDASSGLERRPGIKDPVLVRRFVEAAKGA